MVKIEASVQREKKKSRIKFKSAELDKHLNNKKREKKWSLFEMLILFHVICHLK